MEKERGFYSDAKMSGTEQEFKGAFFTPEIWVKKSQEYLTKVLGDNWQDEYIIWDCCAGTGNMENGLLNAKNVYASTLEEDEVNEIKEKITHGLNLLESHVFQFDFLNESLDSKKIPEKLRQIIHDPVRRKKLVIYINPPFAECGNRKAIIHKDEEQKNGVANSETHDQHLDMIGNGVKELFTQFIWRIYYEMNGCWIGQFSTHKHIYSENFIKFRNHYLAKLEAGFLCPSNTFYGVKGKFPIGFFIWNTQVKEKISNSTLEVYGYKGELIKTKHISAIVDKTQVIRRWLNRYVGEESEAIGMIGTAGSDFQHNTSVHFTLKISIGYKTRDLYISFKTLIPACIYLAIRYCLSATWENNRDNYMSPIQETWKDDIEFQNNCFIFALFHPKNCIKMKDGINQWIPFKENEVGAKGIYESHAMINFMEGKEFSHEAQRVIDWAKRIYQYYHSKSDTQLNAAWYDIRAYFYGRNDAGIMKRSSDDSYFMGLMRSLKCARFSLRDKIIPKIYEHGFLIKE